MYKNSGSHNKINNGLEDEVEITPTLDQIAVRFGLLGDMRFTSLSQTAEKLRMELASAEKEQRERIRELLRGRGFIAEKLEDLQAPERARNFGAGQWEELAIEAWRTPKIARFVVGRDGRSVFSFAYFCTNGCGWVGMEYPPAPMEGWGRTALDPSTSRPCVVCILPVARTPDINYFNHY